MSNKEDIKVDILYEDADCVVVNKPVGIMVHSDGRAKGPFLTDWIVEHFPQTINVGDPMTAPDGTPVNRAGIVHRLDRETSGVLIIAKTAEGHASLKKQFKDRTITKKYLTFVWGEVKEEFGTIDKPIGRSGSDFRKYSAQRGARGDMREAETYWTKIADLKWGPSVGIENDGKNESGKEEKFSFIEVEPKTGRTHQIRVHFNAINHPVVGDLLYAPKRPMALGFERLALHSKSITFTDLSGKKVKIEAPLPNDFVMACKISGIEV
ncbi:MAG: RluA family pseudouridine synthase [Candidatus Paceibacterota bacterium]|jgi:23S rRNA pseudouridine1911/1915/1917 synthase